MKLSNSNAYSFHHTIESCYQYQSFILPSYEELMHHKEGAYFITVFKAGIHKEEIFRGFF